ncbi:hypothetical protein BH11PSE10_BH11PSE10_07580 [soil metagenome]
MNMQLKTVATLLALAAAATQVSAQVTFYENEGFAGRSFTTQRQISNFERNGLGDGAASVVVRKDRWEACEEIRFGGRCIVLRPGRYSSFNELGMVNGALSVRAVSRSARIADDRYAPLPTPVAEAGQIIFYEREGFRGRSFTSAADVGDVRRQGLRDRASSLVITGAPYQVCGESGYAGNCFVLRPGRYESMRAMGLDGGAASVRGIAAATQADNDRRLPNNLRPEITFYEQESFGGRSFTTNQEVGNFDRADFNDRASSVVVVGGPWEACEDARFGGRCMILRPGRYPSFASMGLDNRVSSVRAVSADAVRQAEDRYRTAPMPVYDSRPRSDERLYEADVTSVRAVLGTTGQRCWVERAQVAPEQSRANVPAAIAGALIGGILGHQVGGGRGKDLATVGGVVAGAALGANVGRDGQQQAAVGQDVQRCEGNAGQARPDYWDVTYDFRGQEHRVQMSSAPGKTVRVNEQGEPRT